MVVIGVIMAVAIPNLLNAINRGKQKRTMADMRSVATAMEAYSVDNTSFPVASSATALATTIVPYYMDSLPQRDGWGRAFSVDSVSLAYTIWSGGSDGGALNFSGGPTADFTESIVFANGSFSQWPDGPQN